MSRYDEIGALDRWDHDIPEVVNQHVHDDCEPGEQHDDRPNHTVQPRCPRCYTEIYGPAVIAFSHGAAACHGCGKFSETMGYAVYRELLAEARRKHRGR